MWYEWIFSGIGTTILSGLAGIVIGGISGYQIGMWDSFSALKTVRLWWESVPTAFSITKVGKVLAHTNAKRCDKGIPDMI